ncbi:MAG: hypothetical protein KJ666_03940 [Bacteroidetes bacterium]|nr:hypothetical protein [Bacteroidota bacterium]MBU2584698.1 hypothetical protein [Bacteroidota bacterium]
MSERSAENKLLKKAMRILFKELGPVETSRFLSITNQKRKESVKRHRDWQKGLNKELLFKEIFEEN